MQTIDKIFITAIATCILTTAFWSYMIGGEYNRGKFEQKCIDEHGTLDHGRCLKDKPEIIFPSTQ